MPSAAIRSRNDAECRPQAHRSLRSNFAWALVGNLVYQASQWLNLVVMVKLLDVADVGRFALALAVCTPITTFAALNLNKVQVTDARDEHRFGAFLGVQLLTGLIAVLVISGLTVALNYETSAALLIIMVGLGQALVATRGVFLGFNQKHERMDAVACSTVILGLGSLAALGLTLWWTRDLLLGVIAMQSVKLAVLLGWDVRATARLVHQHTGQSPLDYLRPTFNPRLMKTLIWLGLPLGTTAVVLSIFNNIPRYLIAVLLGDEPLGYFAAILALVTAGTMVTGAAGASALPRLSRYYLIDRTAFLNLLGNLLGLGAILGGLGLIMVFALGRDMLTLFFTPDYAAYTDLFVWSMIFGALTYVTTFLGCGMTAMRRFVVQPLANLGAVVVALVAGWLLIPDHGLIGGVWCLIAGKLTQGLIAATVIWSGLRSGPTSYEITSADLRPVQSLIEHDE